MIFHRLPGSFAVLFSQLSKNEASPQRAAASAAGAFDAVLGADVHQIFKEREGVSASEVRGLNRGYRAAHDSRGSHITEHTWSHHKGELGVQSFSVRCSFSRATRSASS